MSKLLILVCFIGVLGLFLGISFALAQDCEDYCADPSIGLPPGLVCICPGTSVTNLEDLLENVIRYIFWFATVLTPILILIGGFYFITSAGDIERVNTAKRIITYTLVGYTIVIFAWGLVYILADILGQ